MIVSEDDLRKNPNQKFSSGRIVKAGDKVLIGIIFETDLSTNLPIKVITFHEEEFGTVYTQDEKMTKEKIGIDIPVLKKIK